MQDEATPREVGSNLRLGPALPDSIADELPDECARNRVRRYVVKMVVAERDCRTCKHWTPHHRSDVMHCSAALRCVAGSSYQRQGVVQLWEAAPVSPAPF